MRSNVSRIVVVAALLIAPLAARGQTYSNTDYHYSMTLPAGWAPLPKETLDAIPRLVGKAGANMPRYEAGFKLKSNLFLGYPYVLVQTVPAHGTLDQIEREVAKLDGKPVGGMEQIKPELAASTSVNRMQIRLDRERRRIVSQFGMTGPNGKAVQVKTVGFLTKEGVTNVHCYAESDKAADAETAFTALTDSFRLDPGYEFVEQSSGARISGGAAHGAVIGGLVGAGAGLLIYLLKKAKWA